MKKYSNVKLIPSIALSVLLVFMSSCGSNNDNNDCRSALIRSQNYNVYEYNDVDSSSIFLGQIGFEESSDFMKGTYKSSFMNNGNFNRNKCELKGNHLNIYETTTQFGQIGQLMELTVFDVSNVLSNGYHNSFITQSRSEVNGKVRKYIFSITP